MMAGALNKRINFEAQTKTPDGMGGWIVIWKTVASSIAAGIWPISASEQVQAAQVVMTVSHRIRIRYRSILKASWRIRFGTRYFSIISIINPNEKREMFDLLCKEAT